MSLDPAVEKAMHAVADKIAARAKDTEDAEELGKLAHAVSELAHGPAGGNWRSDTDYTYNASIDNHQHHHPEGERRGAGFGS